MITTKNLGTHWRLVINFAVALPGSKVVTSEFPGHMLTILPLLSGI
jgi:hypothetical protein